RAIAQFMLDLHTLENGYTEIDPPLLVRDTAVYGVGQLPKFSGDMFKTNLLQRDRVSKFIQGSVSQLVQEILESHRNEILKFPLDERLSVAREIARPRIEELTTSIVDAVERGEYTEQLWLIPTAEV